MSYAEAPILLPEAGVHPEINQQELPATALTDGENWIMRDGRMRTRLGLTAIGATTGDRPNGFCGYIDDTNVSVLLMGTDDSVFLFDDATQAWVDLSAAYTADATHHTLFEVFQLGAGGGPQTTVYIQNGKDVSKSWTYGAASVTSPSGATVPIAKAMMILADRMIVGNLLGNGGGYTGAIGPQVVAVSNSQDPTAGYNTVLIAQLSDTPGAIVAMQEIGNLQGVIYKTDAIYLATASSSNVPFTFELKRAGTPGPVSPRAVVTASDALQYYLARDGNVMVFDGIEPKPLGRHIQRHILDTWDINVFHKAHGVYDDENRELAFFYCGTGSSEPNLFIKIRLDSASLWPCRFDTLRITAATKALLPGGTTLFDLDVETIGSLGLTLGEYDSLGTSFIMAESLGKTYIEAGYLDEASPIPCFFETGLSDLGQPLTFKSMHFMDHRFTTTDSAQTLSIYLKKSNYGEATVSDAVRTLQLGDAGPHCTFHRFPGRRYALRMSANATQPIEWHGSTAAFAVQGTR